MAILTSFLCCLGGWGDVRSIQIQDKLITNIVIAWTNKVVKAVLNSSHSVLIGTWPNIVPGDMRLTVKLWLILNSLGVNS